MQKRLIKSFSYLLCACLIALSGCGRSDSGQTFGGSPEIGAKVINVDGTNWLQVSYDGDEYDNVLIPLYVHIVSDGTPYTIDGVEFEYGGEGESREGSEEEWMWYDFAVLTNETTLMFRLTDDVRGSVVLAASYYTYTYDIRNDCRGASVGMWTGRIEVEYK